MFSSWLWAGVSALPWTRSLVLCGLCLHPVTIHALCWPASPVRCFSFLEEKTRHWDGILNDEKHQIPLGNEKELAVLTLLEQTTTTKPDDAE